MSPAKLHEATLDLAEFARRCRTTEPTLLELEQAESLAHEVHRAIQASVNASRTVIEPRTEPRIYGVATTPQPGHEKALEAIAVATGH